MKPFQVYVKYVDRIVDMDLIEPGDCSVISLINDTRKFELILVPNAIHFPEDEPTGLLGFKEENISNPVEENKHELVEEDNAEPDEDNNEEGNAEPIT
ncbi:hypothetical protein LWI29_024909 [Acer saccharum]|uniref:Uncharacterized protein n=1 Tax=Acer saccharum TaxID=4024 RepID=A0AA39W2U6_ACESA|nr:hypothetical protein LWI29_024909 [Acer saccharum]